MRRWARLSIRARLALVQGGAFFGMGVAVVAAVIVLVDLGLSPGGTEGTIASYSGCQVAGTNAMPPSAPPSPVPCRVGHVAAGTAVHNGSQADPGLAPRLIQSGAPADQAFIVSGLEQYTSDIQGVLMRNLLLAAAVILPLTALLSGLLGWLIATRMLRPLRTITRTARRLSAADLDQRIALTGPRDELRDLADTFDDMLGRLDSAFVSQRRFVANASHELRTPLAIMRAQIDVALDDSEVSRTELLATSRVVRDAVDRCERLLDGLLLLARSDRGLGATEPVDLAGSAGRALDLVSAAALQTGVELRSDLGPALVRGDPALLDRLVANLVENAVAYNRDAGWVEVTTSNGGPTARVLVVNSGPPVTPDRVPSLFEPFQRLSRASAGPGRGAGLGLSIVRSVARAHGGDVRAYARSMGGLAVEVELPAVTA